MSQENKEKTDQIIEKLEMEAQQEEEELALGAMSPKTEALMS